MMKPDVCPKCGSKNIVHIQYGLVNPDEMLIGDIFEGRTVLGGCMITPDSPAWACVACRHRWGEMLDE